MIHASFVIWFHTACISLLNGIYISLENYIRREIALERINTLNYSIMKITLKPKIDLIILKLNAINNLKVKNLIENSNYLTNLDLRVD